MEIAKIELRALTADDIFPVVTIINKIGIKEFKECFSSPDVMAASGSKEANIEAVGLSVVLDIAAIVMKNLPSCKEDIYSFIASVSGMTREEVAGMPMVDFTELIVEIVKKDEFKGFIKVVSKFLK